MRHRSLCTLKDRGRRRGEPGLGEFPVDLDILAAVEGPRAEAVGPVGGDRSRSVDDELEPRALHPERQHGQILLLLLLLNARAAEISYYVLGAYLGLSSHRRSARRQQPRYPALPLARSG